MSQKGVDSFPSRVNEKIKQFDVFGTPRVMACVSMMNDIGASFGAETATYSSALNTYGDALMVTCIAEDGARSAHTSTDFKAIAALLREAADMFDAVAKRSEN